MNFKIGDKVRVKSIKELEKTYNYVDNMGKFANKVVTISYYDRSRNSYHIAEDEVEYWFYKTAFILADFKLSDIRFADIVTLRNGERYVYVDGYLYSEKNGYGSLIDYWCENLLAYENDEDADDIMKVERAGEVIWERTESEVKEMTIKEISEALGYEVKVVKEKE